MIDTASGIVTNFKSKFFVNNKFLSSIKGIEIGLCFKILLIPIGKKSNSKIIPVPKIIKIKKIIIK